MRFERVRLRLAVCSELRKVRSYRRALQNQDGIPEEELARMEAWIKVADELLESVRAEPDGKRKAYFVDSLFGIRRRPPGSAKFVISKCMHTMNISEGGLSRWRDSAIYTASILAIQYGAIDLSRKP